MLYRIVLEEVALTVSMNGKAPTISLPARMLLLLALLELRT
jgi:hypothetical protein